MDNVLAGKPSANQNADMILYDQWEPVFKISTYKFYSSYLLYGNNSILYGKFLLYYTNVNYSHTVNQWHAVFTCQISFCINSVSVWEVYIKLK